MRKSIATLFRSESGATAIEYGLIASLLAIAMIAFIDTMGTKLAGTFNTLEGSLAPLVHEQALPPATAAVRLRESSVPRR